MLFELEKKRREGEAKQEKCQLTAMQRGVRGKRVARRTVRDKCLTLKWDAVCRIEERAQREDCSEGR